MATGERYYTPEPALLDKHLYGMSDSYGANGVYKFMGCSILSVNMSLGFNSTASSVSVTLVEDFVNGDTFVQPAIPSLWAISLPKGGVGQPVIYDGSISLQPDGYFSNSTPFYFTGICTSWTVTTRDAGGKTITVNLVDPREFMSGVQCLLSGFALSNEIGAGRQVNVNNVIDVFGYWDGGMESGRNEFGMQWNKIKEVIEAVRVKLYGINIEFYYNGPTFSNTPFWYRLDDQLIDLLSLSQRVAEDAGADFIIFARKVNVNTMVIEIRGIQRTNANFLTKTEISRFITARNDIVDNVRIGKENKNEPTSSIIVGGAQNANYLALPTVYNLTMHTTANREDYTKFPPDIKTRLFGGVAHVSDAPADGSAITLLDVDYTDSVQTGAIFPFWGFSPDDHAWPFIEPFLPLDHLLFDKDSNLYAKCKSRIPLCSIKMKDFLVRIVDHNDVFQVDDGDADYRPFAYVESYLLQAGLDQLPGYARGLPLNTEVLRASLVHETAFWDLYTLYYPDIGAALGLGGPDWVPLKAWTENAANLYPDMRKVSIGNFLQKPLQVKTIANDLARDADKKIAKGSVWAATNTQVLSYSILTSMRTIIYEHVKNYAAENMGKKFLVCLPKSQIMARIWAGLEVPTRKERPEIEYRTDQVGFWTNVPTEFDGIVNKDSVTFSSSSEEQIRRKFMAEDGRFSAMVVMDWKPTGNINFNSNGNNKAMFQDLDTSTFRPNKIAEGNPQYVFISPNVTQLPKRPDLALVEIQGPVYFDPTPGYTIYNNSNEGFLDDEELATLSGIMKYFNYFLSKDDTLREAMKASYDKLLPLHIIGQTFIEYSQTVFLEWAKQLKWSKSQWFQRDMSTEPIMDLKGIVIPLTSNCVTYGPWFYTYAQAQGQIRIEVDESLVPWNFEILTEVDPDSPYLTDGLTPMQRLDNAGFERLERSLADLEYLDNAAISVCGFPEIGPGNSFGYNSNLTGISVDFGIGGVKTVYNLSTYAQKPGTFRKSEYDNVSRARIDSRRNDLPNTLNNNLIFNVMQTGERNKFRDPYSS